MPRRALEPGQAAPILKWAGGKSQLLPELLARLPREFGSYHEPFVGGGALFFALWNAGRIAPRQSPGGTPPAPDRAPDRASAPAPAPAPAPGRAVLSDVNRDLIETYEAVRDDVDAVIAALGRHKNDEKHFYRVRAQDRARLSPAARAARVIYLNKTGFNGLYRVNSKGGFNVPFGDNPRANFCDERLLRPAAEAFRAADLHVESFETVLGRAQAGDFVYFDPPYQPLSKTAYFTAYSRGKFDETEQKRLRDVFHALAARGVHVLLSNSDAPFTREIYAGFKIDVVRAARNINSKADRRGEVTELLISANL